MPWWGWAIVVVIAAGAVMVLVALEALVHLYQDLYEED